MDSFFRLSPLNRASHNTRRLLSNMRPRTRLGSSSLLAVSFEAVFQCPCHTLQALLRRVYLPRLNDEHYAIGQVRVDLCALLGAHLCSTIRDSHISNFYSIADACCDPALKKKPNFFTKLAPLDAIPIYLQ